MTNLLKMLDKINREYGQFLAIKDLIALKLFSSPSCVTKAKLKGNLPPYIKLPSGKIIFLKDDIIDFIKKHYNSNKEDSFL